MRMDEQRRWGRIIACLCLVFLVGLPAVGYAQDDRVEKLIRDLKDEDSVVRSDATWALWNIFRDDRVVEPLMAALKDEDLSVRWHAAWALGKIGNAKAIGPLKELARKDPNPLVRQSAKEALAKIRGK